MRTLTYLISYMYTYNIYYKHEYFIFDKGSGCVPKGMIRVPTVDAR